MGEMFLQMAKKLQKKIRQHEVTNNVSVVSSFPNVRKELVRRQQALAKESGVVMDGRDIGTVVLPNADVKIFLIASVEERANRRYLENKKKGIETNYERLKEEIIASDDYESYRKESTIKQAEDAICVDTTGLSITEVVNKCV